MLGGVERGGEEVGGLNFEEGRKVDWVDGGVDE